MTRERASPEHPWRWLACWAGALFVLALGLRLYQAVHQPLFSSDGAYYYAVAERLHAGQGLTIPYVWNYLAGIPKALPIASHQYWMPMTSLLEAGAFALAGGASPLAGQMPSVVLGAVLAPFTFVLAHALFGRQDAAVVAGLFWAISPHLVSIAASTDCFMAAAAFTSAAVYAIWKAREGRPLWAALAGAAAGLAYLTRSDGLLLAVVMGLVLIRPLASRERWAWTQAAAFGGVFALVALPWWVRNALVLGHPFGSGMVRTAWLVTYNDIFRANAASLTPARYFASSQVMQAGFKAFVVYKELRLLAVIGGVAAALAVYALAVERDRKRFAPWLVYLGLVIGASALVFPYPTIKGGFWHIVAGLCPFVFALAGAGLMRLWDWAGAGSLRWRQGLAWAVAAATFGYLLVLHPVLWRKAAHQRDAFAETRRDLARVVPENAAVLTDNCWRLYYYARRPCAQFPMDGAGAALRVADALGARYAVVQRSSLADIAPIGRTLETARFTRIAALGDRGHEVYVYRITDPSLADRQARALNREAITAAKAGRYEAAIAAWRGAESLKPDFAPILGNLALAYWRSGQPREAYLCARRALELDPSNQAAQRVVSAAEAGS